jgi:hypothetical protein
MIGIAFTAGIADAQVAPAYAGELNRVVEQCIVSDSSREVDATSLRTFEFPQTIFPVDGGKVLLRAYDPLKLRMDERSETVTVEGWDISLKCEQVYDLPRYVVRQFLGLLAKSNARTLTNAEQMRWLKILDQVDFQQFCIDRAMPHYLEGTLISRRLGQPSMVEWADGSRNSLHARVALPLTPLEPGDDFAAYVKLGKDNEVISIESVSLLATV